MIYTTTCPVCGKIINGDTKDKGRPRTYCSPLCAEIEKKWQFITKHLTKAGLTHEAQTAWKGRFFRERNLILKEGYSGIKG